MQRRLYAEQVKQLYSNALVGLLATAINSLVLAVIQRDVTPHITLIAWIALLAAISLVRYIDTRTFWQRSSGASEANYWGRRFMVGLALSGMVWGSSAIFLFPIDSLAHQTFLAFVVGGMVAGAAGAFSSIMKAFLAYSVPALSPIIVRFALLGDEFHLAMGGMTLLFGVMMFFIAIRINAVRITSVKLRFENSGLSSHLAAEKEKSDELNEKLLFEIREREKIERELLAEKYSTLFNATSDGVWIHNLGGEILEVNDAYCCMSGYSRDELMHASIGKLEAVETPEEIANHIKKVVETGGHDRFESRHRRKDGSFFDVEITAAYFERGGGKIAIFVRDISERKRMEEELRKSHDELELRVQERTGEVCRQAELLDLAHDAIVVRETEGAIRFWNKGAEEMYGWTKEEALGKIMRDLVQTQFPSPRNKIMAKLMQEGRWEGELVHTRKDGKKINVLGRWVLQRDEEGKPTGVMLINTDITHRVKLEAQLRQAQKLESIGTLTGGIAHDFNNILGAIVINSEMALFDLPRVSGLRSNLELILKSGIRGQDLVRQMLLFSLKSEKKQEVITLIPIIKETFKLLRSSIPTTIQMKLNLETESDAVYADPSQIQQVIMNLCTNAAYAMRGTTGSIDISLQAITFGSNDLPDTDMQPGDYLVLSVRDTGSGMDEEIQKRIFEPFFTTKPAGEGTGLGLSVAYGIVKSHKGNITVYSEPARGSTFTVYLPKADTDVSVKAETLRPAPKGKESILLVDDEEIIVNSVRNMLQHLGYKVTALMDSQEALKLFSEDPSRFDLVMTDQTMPLMTGEDLGKVLMNIRSDIPVILCTGYSNLISSEKAMAMGFRGYIMKPFTVREGAELVRRVLDQDRSK